MKSAVLRRQLFYLLKVAKKKMMPLPGGKGKKKHIFCDTDFHSQSRIRQGISSKLQRRLTQEVEELLKLEGMLVRWE